jgi:hypothetical protein
MAFELQIRSSTFALIVARAVQRLQMTTCVGPWNGHYIDHANPVAEQARWTINRAGKTTLLLPIEMFLVHRDELVAATGHTPPGATTPKGRVELEIVVTVEKSALVVTVDDVNLGAAEAVLGDAADDVKRAIKDAASPGPRIDLGALLGNLGIDASTSVGTVTVVDDLLVARFGDPAGAVAPVRHDFEWGIFLDGTTLEDLLRARIPKSMPPLQSVTPPTVQWAPSGAVAFLRALVEGPVEVPDPWTCRVTISLNCTLSMSGSAPALRIDTAYDFAVDTGLLAFSTEANIVLQVVVDLVKRNAVKPAAFGAERTGDQSFAITLPLPEIRVAGEPWRYDGMVVDHPGMVLGGSVALPVDLSHVVLSTTTHPFSGGNVASLFCSRGHPPTDVPLEQFFRTVAVVEYEGGDFLCDVEVIPGGLGFEKRLTLPKAETLSGGVRPGKGSIFMGFDPASANDVTERIQLIVRTPRGVRCCDLGRPEHFMIKEDGTIDGGLVFYFDDCNQLPPNFGEMTPEEYERWSGIIWYTYWGLVPGRDYDPDNPPILPDTLEEIPERWEESRVVVPDTGRDGADELIVYVPDEFRVSRVTPESGIDIATEVEIPDETFEA